MNTHPDIAKPVASPPPSGRTQAGRGRTAAGPSSSAPKHRVLIVDDEESIVASLRRLFRREPYELVTAGDGEEALRMLEDQPAHLVISDQRMPGMTGIELLGEIRRRWPDTLRIILSGYSDVSTIIAAINEGEIYKFVTKPWNDEEIKLHVRRALEQYDLAAENERMAREIGRQNEKLRELNELLDQRATDASTGLTFAQELLEAIDVGVLTVDPSGLIVGANARARDIVSPRTSELIGVPADVALPQKLHEAIGAPTTASDGTRSGRHALEGKPLQYRVSPLVAGGHHRGHVVVLWEEVP